MSDIPLHKLQRVQAELDRTRAELKLANEKLAKLSRMIEIAERDNDGMTDAEVAVSASFAEAMAITAGQMAEEERDRWREMARELANNGFFKTRDTLNQYYALEEKEKGSK